MPERNFDVLVLGSGAAGLTAALELAPELKVGILAKGDISAGSTALAQGGIAAVLEPGDTFESHIEDTIVAGAGLNNRRAVEFVVENAPAAIERLAELGVPFNPGETDRWHLTRAPSVSPCIAGQSAHTIECLPWLAVDSISMRSSAQWLCSNRQSSCDGGR